MLITRFFYDSDGTLVREIEVYPDLRITYTGVATGESLTYKIGSPAIVRFPEGATIGAPVTLEFHGLTRKLPERRAAAEVHR